MKNQTKIRVPYCISSTDLRLLSSFGRLWCEHYCPGSWLKSDLRNFVHHPSICVSYVRPELTNLIVVVGLNTHWGKAGKGENVFLCSLNQMKAVGTDASLFPRKKSSLGLTQCTEWQATKNRNYSSWLWKDFVLTSRQVFSSSSSLTTASSFNLRTHLKMKNKINFGSCPYLSATVWLWKW